MKSMTAREVLRVLEERGQAKYAKQIKLGNQLRKLIRGTRWTFLSEHHASCDTAAFPPKFIGELRQHGAYYDETRFRIYVDGNRVHFAGYDGFEGLLFLIPHWGGRITA